MTEQEQTTELERLCGGSTRAFQLMRIWQDTSNPVGGSTFPLAPSQQQIARINYFKQRAKAVGYNDATIRQYLLLQGID